MFTLADASAHGWLIETDGEDGTATKDTVVYSVKSATPVFTLLLSIAEVEGVPFALGYGGAEPITADLVKACSGETYVEPPPPPPPPPTTNEYIASALSVIHDEAALSDAGKQAIANIVAVLEAS